MEYVLKYGNVLTYYTLLFKLGMFNYFWLSFNDIFNNGVIDKKRHMESMLITIEKFLLLLETNLNYFFYYLIFY